MQRSNAKIEGFRQEGAAILADIFAVVMQQAVTLAGNAMLQQTSSSELEALFDAALRLEFGHFRLRICDVRGRPRQPISAGQSH